jgi:hypothetical protein
MGVEQLSLSLVLRDERALLSRALLEHVLGLRPGELLPACAQAGVPTHEVDRFAEQLWRDSVRLARGELSTVEVPRRLPRPGEWSVPLV